MSVSSVIAAVSAGEALLSKLTAAETTLEGVASVAYNLIAPAVVAAEATGQAGADKERIVLNTVEAQIAKLPSLAVNFGDIAEDVSKVITEIVADYTNAKLFARKLVGEVKAAL